MISACSGSSAEPVGGGICAITASMMSGTPSPVFALARIASCASMPITSSISRDRVVRVGRRQVDLVEHRHDLDAELDRGVAVRDRLRLDALGRVDDEQRAFARRQRAADLVREVDVARRVDQVEVVQLAVRRPVLERRGLRLDRDAALALEVHRVEHLRLHLAIRQAAAELDDAIGQRRLAVVDVGDDGEVADVLHRGRRGGFGAGDAGIGRTARRRRRRARPNARRPGTVNRAILRRTRSAFDQAR